MSLSAGQAGAITGWTVRVIGDRQTVDNLYVYTSDYGRIPDPSGAHATLTDDNGGEDTLNAAAIPVPCIVDLTPGGSSSTLNGKPLAITEGTVIEVVYTGDGDDSIVGNDASNRLYGG